jgi:hypothetical protein
MQVITELVATARSRGAVGLRLAATFVTSALIIACSQTPTSPSKPGAGNAGLSPSVSSAQETGKSWQEFEAHGWNCRTPNNGPVTVCSPPGQPLPVVAFPPSQPPEDRPPTVLLKRWRDGVFEANVLLIRPEIYNGQICESTGLAYTYAGFLGYFECAH